MCVKYTFHKKINGKPNKSGPVRVTSINYKHSSDCNPSPNQLLVARRASGDYSKLSENMVAHILTMLRHDPGISTRALRAMLKPHLQKRKHISSLEIFNMKVRVRLMHEVMQIKGLLKCHQVNMSNLFKGLDDEQSDIIDKASSHMNSSLQKVLTSGSQGWKLLSVLEKLIQD
jgi:hypothetical protein